MQTIWFIFMFFIALIFILVIFNILKKLPVALSINKQIKVFAYHADDESVKEFIRNLKKLSNIQNNPSNWDTMRAAFELVNDNDEVSFQIKTELRKVLMGMGVNRLQKVNKSG